MAIVISSFPGELAARYAAESLRRILVRKSLAQVVFATGASQFRLLECLVENPTIDWSRVSGWHLDEYLGLAGNHPASFQHYLRQRLVDRVPMHRFRFIQGDCDNPALECRRLKNEIGDLTIDLALIGIGENGHVAFNDPPANFETTESFIEVDLDQACRQQQCSEGWFAALEEVPRQAITMTCHQILKSNEIICTVPDARKAIAVQNSLSKPCTPLVPASCLQQHSRITFVLDEPAAARLPAPEQSPHVWYRQQTLLPTKCLDLQINGCFGVDFNSDSLTGGELRTACLQLEQRGVVGILLTLITDELTVMKRRISNIARLREQDDFLRDFIRGIHLEGPFLSAEPGYCGAHPKECTVDAAIDRIAPLIDAGDGLVRWVTLAPERDRRAVVTRYLVEKNIVVAAGHTNANLDELKCAIDQGLSVFTHLGNACPLELPRHDNIIQRALSLREQLIYTLIADGVHVPDNVWRWWLDWLGPRRVVLVSDATSAAGCGPGQYRLGRQTITVGENARTQFDKDSGLLAGSTQLLPEIIARLSHAEPQLSATALEVMAFGNAQSILSRSMM